MNIDWSKAPEGATHYGPDCDMFEACWYKVDTNGEVFCMLADNDDEFEHVTSLPKNAIERPQEWTDTGLPQVGTVCECFIYDSMLKQWAWKTGELIYYNGNNEFAVKADGTLRWCDQFRPIRTKEQIEAEEREKAISHFAYVLYRDIGMDRRDAELLWNNGYRKQPKDDA